MLGMERIPGKVGLSLEWKTVGVVDGDSGACITIIIVAYVVHDSEFFDSKQCKGL